jgi:hypothetical protein
MKTALFLATVVGMSIAVSSCGKEEGGVIPPPTPPEFYIEKKDKPKLLLEPKDYLDPASPNTILCC